MTGTLDAQPATPDVDRPEDLGLARLHLRLGSLGLARAELEGLAGADRLDEEGLVDLAEARWRTGDLAGAGEAASAALASGNEAVVAYVIAAEATAAVGRPGEARRLASRALELADLDVADVFAGMPRASVWPVDPGDEQTSESLFGTSGDPSGRLPKRPERVGSHTGGLWDDHDSLEASLPEPGLAFEAGRTALEAGDTRSAALHLGLALRTAPALAPAILELAAENSDPAIALLRGDAYRLVGHERDARLAFADAAAALRDPNDGHPTHKERS